MEFLQIKLTTKPPTEDKRQNRELYFFTAQLKSVGTFMEASHWHFSISCYFCYAFKKKTFILSIATL